MINHDLLVSESLKLFHKRGIRATMDELANNLRISKRTLYEQVGNKADLVAFIMNYWTEKMDDNYKNVMSIEDISMLDRFKMLLFATPKEIYFNSTQVNELKLEYPLLFQDYENRLDKRWDSYFNVFDEYLKTIPSVKIDKEVFRSIVISALEGLYNYTDRNNTNFNDLAQEMIQLLLSSLQVASTEVIGEISLSNLLSSLSVGVCLFHYVYDEMYPLYLSQGFYDLYDKDEINQNTRPSTKIHPNDCDYFYKSFDKVRKENEKGYVDINYRVISNDKVKWHHTRAMKIVEDKDVRFLAVIFDITENKESEMNLKISEEKLQLAFEQTQIAIWEYDILNDRLHLSPSSKQYFNITHDYIDEIPLTLIKNKSIHYDSINTINNFWKKMINGEKSANCVIKLLDKGDIYSWVKVSYKSIFDTENKPIKAIGILEKINKVIDVKSRFNQEEVLTNVLAKELLISFKINLSEKKVVKTINSNIIRDFNDEGIVNYDDLLSSLKKVMIYEEEQQSFLKMFSYDTILKVFEQGKTSGHMTFRCCKSSGQIIWASYTVNLVIEPITGSLYMFGYIRDVDTKTKLELSLSRKVEYDATTRLYIPATIKKMTNAAIAEVEDPKQICGFAIMEIINFGKIKRQYGLDIAEKLLFFIGRILRICFNNKNIVGRISDNQFAIFFPSVINSKELKKRIDDTISIAHNSYILSTNEEKIAHITTSLVFKYIGEASYDRLLYLTLKQLEKNKNIKDNNDDIIDNINEFEKEDSLVQTQFNKNDINYSMIDTTNIEITELLLQCTTVMLSNKTTTEVFEFILSKINEYYTGYRAYILECNVTLKNVSCTYEYGEGQKDITRVISNLSFDKITNLVQLGKDIQPVMIDNVKKLTDLNSVEKSIFKDLDVNSCYLVPLTNEGKILGYVGVDNPKEHVGDISLLLALAYFITNELIRDKIEEKQKHINEYDALTQLKNHSAFRKRVYDLRKMMLSSLGVACICINNLRKINSDYGSEYGDSMVLVVSQALKHQFRDLDLYRYESEKFAILCPDIDYHIFNDKLKRVIDEISEVRLGLISAGNTWADNDIDIEKLIIHSEEIAAINKKEIGSDTNQSIIINEKKINLVESIEKGWFEVFLQPKFDLKTKQVCGAEALIRMNHPIYGLISPAKIIPILERDNLISYIDLFVLEKVCQLLSKWQKAKLKLFPLAVNFSRRTLLEKDIIEKTTDILNKYNISKSLIEIEITESIGNMEQKIIAEIANKFVTANIRLAIDDFGSKFSSLSTLSVIPFNVVKLDKSIVNDLVINSRNQIILEYVIRMCKELKMISVAEGIETEAQLNALLAHGCDFGQGYYFEKPISIDDFEEKYNSIKE